MQTKPSQIRELTVEEIKGRLRELEDELFSLRFRQGTKQGLTNTMRIRMVKRDIARHLTILGEKNK